MCTPIQFSWGSLLIDLSLGYFVANNVTSAETKRSILLSMCGPSTLKLIKSLVDHESLGTKSFEDICELVKTYHEPAPSPIVQRYKFNTRVRAAGETVAAYVAALRGIAEHCKYGATLQEMLRDRLVCGVNHKTIQKRLLSERDLTYEKAYSLAQAIEAAERDAENLKPGAVGTSTTDTSTTREQQVLYNQGKKGDKVPFPPPPSNGGKTCYRCGGNHLAPACKHKDTECRFCKKKGHLARVCRSKKSLENPPKKPNPKKNLFVSEDNEGVYDLYAIQNQANEPTRLNVYLNEVPIEMVLDTGASLSIINQATFDEIKQHSPTVTLVPSTARLQTYTGELIPIVGSTQLSVRYGTIETCLSVQVVDGTGPNLMGRDWLNRLKVTGGQVNLVEHDQLKEVLDKHKAVMDGSLGCLKGAKVNLIVDDKVKPKFYKPRTVPLMLKDKVEQELSRLEHLGIISPVQHSQWAAPIVPVVKKDGSVRICGDFKTTVNQACPTESYPLPRVDELFADLAGGKYFTKLDMSNAYLQLPLSDQSKQLVTINTHKGLFQYNRLPLA